MKREYQLTKSKTIDFNNKVDFCVGTGRMGLALTAEYQKQLALVQKEIGFQYIRGHGLFSDDMSIYHEYKEDDGTVRVEYNFTYLDLVMDSYRDLHIRPFLELGFMPGELASGEQTIFYWKGNTTPPKSYDNWCNLVTATLQHLCERYGETEVLQWPIEVWNEPNLPGFWKGADMEEYFHLFETTFLAIKKLNPQFKVGGPAICGVRDKEWTLAFMEFCRNKKLKPDFYTRHHYTSTMPERQGHYGYMELHNPDDGIGGLHVTREQIDSFPEYKGLPIHITEFNTSYIPNAPIHDTNINAAYLAYLLSRLGEDNESYSYWTFGDIFEESGVPFSPFHGGFGLVANGQIPKPTFWSFAFFKKLIGGECVHKSKEAVVVRGADGGYRGVAWNYNKNAEEALELSLKLEAGDKQKQFCLLTKTVDEESCNPLKIWHDLGEPQHLSTEQRELLIAAAQPRISSQTVFAEGVAAVELKLNKNAVVYFEIKPVTQQAGDRGYDYSRVMAQREEVQK